MWAIVAATIASAAPANTDARSAIIETVERAYVQGVHVQADPELMRSGFHDEFRMFVPGEDGLRLVTLDDWAGRVAASSVERPATNIRHEIPVVDVEGDAAVARVEIHRGGAHVFTDYLSLYRFHDGWKIVGKIYFTHPR